MVAIEEVEVMVRNATTDDGVGVTQLKKTSSKLQEQVMKKRRKNCGMHKCISS
jgi:hypothetical protein